MYHIANAEITPELHDDLIGFSFDKLQLDDCKNYQAFFPDHHGYTSLTFVPRLLEKLVWYRFHSRMKFCLFISYDTAII